jgi:hypothetical protein
VAPSFPITVQEASGVRSRVTVVRVEKSDPGTVAPDRILYDAEDVAYVPGVHKFQVCTPLVEAPPGFNVVIQGVLITGDEEDAPLRVGWFETGDSGGEIVSSSNFQDPGYDENLVWDDSRNPVTVQDIIDAWVGLETTASLAPGGDPEAVVEWMDDYEELS